MDREILKKLIDRNLSVRKIAEELDTSYTNVRYWLGKHDLKTLSTSKRTWTDEDLVVAVSSSSSMAEVLRRLGLSDSSAGNYTKIKKHVEDRGLDTTHWLGQAWSSDPEKSKFLRTPMEEILVEGSTFGTSSLRVRLIKEGLKREECESCGISEWLGKKLPLELDHINGVPNDHRIENLRLLCPNCHALTPTWRGRKNKKHGFVAQ